MPGLSAFAAWHRICSSGSTQVLSRRGVLHDFKSYPTSDKHPTLRRLAHSATFVRMTVVVAWTSMVAMLSLLALILDRMIF